MRFTLGQSTAVDTERELATKGKKAHEKKREFIEA
jgi:hypothetical protein